jgi:predicted nucleic acid-binding Zn ribbon protein
VGIGAAVDAFVKDLGLRPTLAEYDVITSWAEVVGEQIARVAVAQRMDRGILTVGVSSASWRAELSMRRVEIVKKLNSRAGTQLVREIRFR